MKTRPYANPFTALIVAARETSCLPQLARTIAYGIEREGSNRDVSAPTVSRRIIRDIEETTSIKLELVDDRFWQATY